MFTLLFNDSVLYFREHNFGEAGSIVVRKTRVEENKVIVVSAKTNSHLLF